MTIFVALFNVAFSENFINYFRCHGVVNGYIFSYIGTDTKSLRLVVNSFLSNM